MSPYNYLAQGRNYQILNHISDILQQNILPGSSNLSSLADRSISKRDWSTVLLKGYDERKTPVFTSELITCINVDRRLIRKTLLGQNS